MHTAFTGSARRTRQVNLSGRSNANPWATLPGVGNSTQAAGTQNTLANVQADRARRQHERDRQNAAKTIQRAWRGHSSRRALKQKRREEWDRIEQERQGFVDDIEFQNDSDQSQTTVPYPSVESCLQQMLLLTRFIEVRRRQDFMRLIRFSDAMEETAMNAKDVGQDPLRTKLLHKFLELIALEIDCIASQSSKFWKDEESVLRLLRGGVGVVKIMSQVSQADCTHQFRALRHLLVSFKTSGSMKQAITDYILAVLSRPATTDLSIYKSFAVELLASEDIRALPSVLEFLSPTLRLTMLSRNIVSFAQSDLSRQTKVEDLMWMLSYLLYIRSFGASEFSTFTVWIQAVSTLLSRCANETAIRIDEIDQPMQGTESAPSPLHPFVREHISTLAQKESVESIVEQLRRTGNNGQSIASLAKPLANYAVALLRAFPTKALNIRMWLYRSSPQTGRASLSTIQYLWQAAQTTGVFQKIVKNSRSVMSVLTEAAPEHNQIGRAPASPQETAVWQEEWRIVLLFLELYTFILKIMDDEEFFALDDRVLQVKSETSSPFSQGALPLRDVASMTTFLKHLVFPLYWNAADLAETNEIEEMGGLSALFGIAPVEASRSVEKREPRTLAGNGVSQAYLKDRVTGVLRMLHERDSRRNFLPEDYWLMTNHVDIQGFISDVVVEEERRHDMDEDEDDEGFADDDDDDLGHDDPTTAANHFTSMFGIRPPHMSRNQTSRFNDMLVKRRERAKRRRQAESLVPRLEILRNLPFFIPFETRVQIFREFVFRDQFRRRNGYVDPDEWRVAVASGLHGRGFEGFNRGVSSINRHRANIHRDSVFEDAFESFYEIGEELKEPIQISFIDQFGTEEAGIDGGGVTKEFLMSVTGEAFDPNQEVPMFVENEQRYLYPNPKILERQHQITRRKGLRGEEAQKEARDLLQRYEFLGRIVGKCMYEGILVDLNFAGFFLLKWALTGGTTSATNETAYRASINDLRDYDEALYQGLLKLKNYRGDVESDFGLNFTASDEVELDSGHRYTWTKDIVPGGSNMLVTNANRLVYIDKITRYRLQQQPLSVTNAFLKGLGQVIQPMWLAMFNQRELQKLVGGDNAELDINDLRRNTQYGGVYMIGDDGLEHKTVALFWKVLKDMNDVDRRKVLKFVTSTPRAPLLGFSHLNPRFSIRDSSEDQTRLPSTSTCVNLLKLPRYEDEETMREKLLYAVNSGAGFDLS